MSKCQEFRLTIKPKAIPIGCSTSSTSPLFCRRLTNSQQFTTTNPILLIIYLLSIIARVNYYFNTINSDRSLSNSRGKYNLMLFRAHEDHFLLFHSDTTMKPKYLKHLWIKISVKDIAQIIYLLYTSTKN